MARCRQCGGDQIDPQRKCSLKHTCRIGMCSKSKPCKQGDLCSPCGHSIKSIRMNDRLRSLIQENSVSDADASQRGPFLEQLRQTLIEEVRRCMSNSAAFVLSTDVFRLTFTHE